MMGNSQSSTRSFKSFFFPSELLLMCDAREKELGYSKKNENHPPKKREDLNLFLFFFGGLIKRNEIFEFITIQKATSDRWIFKNLYDI